MHYWTRSRWMSLAIHVVIVLIPFLVSAVSAFLFWQRLFLSPLIAGVMVSVVDVLALLGLVFYIAQIESPFQFLRHLLPFVSILPLGLEMYALLAHNSLWIAVSVASVVTIILVVIAWQCFRTIESLFIDPISAARQHAQHHLQHLVIADAALRATREAATQFAQAWATTDTPQLSSADGTVTPQLTTAEVKALAAQRNVSERTIWRQLKAGTLQMQESEA